MRSEGRARRTRKPAPRWLARASAVFGVLVMAGMVAVGAAGTASAWHTRAQERPVAGWLTTRGSVVGVDADDTGRGYVYASVVSFVDRAGVAHRFTAPTSSHLPTIGDDATVSYDPRNPADAHDLSASGWIAPFATGIFILSFAGVLLARVVWLTLRERRRRHAGSQPGVVPARSPSSSSLAVAMWLPRVGTVGIAVVLYVVLRSSRLSELGALVVTAGYLVVTLGFLTYLARLTRRRHSTATTASTRASAG